MCITMKLQVNPEQRYAKMRAHTATHLLHAELAQIFPTTKQAGSLVDIDLLRFDFYAERLLTQRELQELEITINQHIYEALPVELIETSFTEAQKFGAKAFFEEKYGDEVRIIRIMKGEDPLSVELCGGTHVSNTKEIGAFTILSQEAVASGIKRLTAITGPKVIEKINQEESLLDSLVEQFAIKSYAQIPEKATKMFKEYEEMESKLEGMESQLIHSLLQSAPRRSTVDFTIIIEVPSDTNFKVLGHIAKDIFKDASSILLYSSEGNYLIISDGSISAKSLAHKYQLRGGGSDTAAQGKDPQVTQIS